MMVFFETYKMDENVFSEKVKPSILVGREKEANTLEDYLKSEGIYGVFGETGIGKTHLVEHVGKRNASRYKLILINCAFANTRAEIQKEIEDGLKPWDKLFRKKIVVAFDEIQYLGEDSAAFVQGIFDEQAHAVILITADKERVRDVFNVMAQRRMYQDIELGAYTVDDLKELIKERIGRAVNPFSEGALEAVVRVGKPKPSDTLKNARIVCEKLHKKKKSAGGISAVDVDKIFFKRKRGGKKEALVVQKEKPPTRSSAIEEFEGRLAKNQVKLVRLLGEGKPLTYNEIVEKSGWSKGAVSAQVNRLSLKGTDDDRKMMTKKGITEPVVERVEIDGKVKITLTSKYKYMYGAK